VHWGHYAPMSKVIQIRDVNDDTYRTLRTRAAAEGLSLTAYVRRQLDHLASLPSMAEWLSDATNRTWGVEDRAAVERALRESREEADARWAR
jgi:hypothetical protein